MLVACPRRLVGNRKRMRMRSFAPALAILDAHVALERVACRSGSRFAAEDAAETGHCG